MQHVLNLACSMELNLGVNQFLHLHLPTLRLPLPNVLEQY